MKRKNRLWLGAAVGIFIALFLVARNAASWRPQTLGKVGQNARHALVFSPNGRFGLMGFTEIWDFSGSQPRRLRNLGENDSFYGFADENSYWSAKVWWRPPNNLFGKVQISRRDLETGRELWKLKTLPMEFSNNLLF